MTFRFAIVKRMSVVLFKVKRKFTRSSQEKKRGEEESFIFIFSLIESAINNDTLDSVCLTD